MQIASRQYLWNMKRPSATRLDVRAEPGAMTVRIAGGDIASGSSGVTVSWGDGETFRYRTFDGILHTYAQPGEYRIVISDDLSSFGFARYDMSGAERGMLAEFVSCGDKVTSIRSYGFNCCGRMRGKVTLPNVTDAGNYTFGSCGGITEIDLPSVTVLQGAWFYSNCTATKLYADNARRIYTSFFEYYGGNLVDLYLRGMTCGQIRGMGGFPFMAGGHVRFHGSDGVIDRNGRNVQAE